MLKNPIQKGKEILVVLFILSQLILLWGCSSNSTSDVTNDNVEVSTTSTPLNVVPPEDDINSGKTVDEDQTGNKPDNTDNNVSGIDFTFPVEGIRPYAVMIDNEGTRPLPQGGLNLAQVVYEIIVEGGVTRLMPVFWDQNPTMIGPVRSSRHYFLDYMMEHDAIYVHFGYSPMAMNDISKFRINNINGVANGGEVFWDLTKDRRNWQDSYTSMEKLENYVKKVKYRTKTEKELVFKYSDKDKELPGDNKAVNVDISYSTGYKCGYKYDADKKIYLRYRKGDPQMERVSGEQLTAKNIIVQMVKNYLIKGDDYGRQEVNTVGNGEGYYISNGKYIKIKWSKKARTEKTQYVDTEGNDIVLNPGQTWVQITPVNGTVRIEP